MFVLIMLTVRRVTFYWPGSGQYKRDMDTAAQIGIGSFGGAFASIFDEPGFILGCT